ncbi:hypothetical protein EA770_07095 [Acinetobacter baumannii]|nr:hypothetical protein EA770_07095 [Acinetobacter baumannii]
MYKKFMKRFIVAIISFLFSIYVFANEKLFEDKTIQVDKAVVERSIFKANVERQILRAWNVPVGSNGKVADAVLILDEQGGIKDLVVSSSDFEMKKSVEQAIRRIAPIKLPPNLKLTDNKDFKIRFTFKSR